MFKVCPDHIVRRCVPEEEFSSILSFATHMLVEDILVQRRPLQKYCSVDFTGLPYLEMHMNFVLHVIDAKERDAFHVGTRCPFYLF